MDHVGTVARREAAKLVVQRIREIAKGAPVVLTGDFNVDQTNEIYRIFTDSGILKDSYHAARLRFAENGTFNSFKPEMFTTSRIDHVFVSPKTRVEAYGLMTNGYWTPVADSDKQQKASDAPQEISFSRYQFRLPSDHYPIFVRLTFKR
jgi:endonuclease/exonuclease/phosphatase family metal-dependent hydrolase